MVKMKIVYKAKKTVGGWGVVRFVGGKKTGVIWVDYLTKKDAQKVARYANAERRKRLKW